jgi:hypothetical protein
MSPRPRRVFALGAAFFLIVHGGWFTLAQAPGWRRVAVWFRDLPLT